MLIAMITTNMFDYTSLIPECGGLVQKGSCGSKCIDFSNLNITYTACTDISNTTTDLFAFCLLDETSLRAHARRLLSNNSLASVDADSFAGLTFIRLLLVLC